MTVEQGSWSSLKAQRRERFVLMSDHTKYCGKNAICSRIWGIGRILTGEDWGRGDLLSRNKGPKAYTYWTNLRKNRSLLWIYSKGSVRGSWGRYNCQGRLGPDCERKVLVEDVEQGTWNKNGRFQCGENYSSSTIITLQ